MRFMPIGRARRRVIPSDTTPASSDVPRAVRIAGTVLRSMFIACLLIITVRVSLPQNETVWTAYDTPGDLVRMALGVAVCLWMLFELFRRPKDAHGYRIWFYFGLAAVPFALICIFATW